MSRHLIALALALAPCTAFADLPIRTAAIREADQAAGTAGLASQRLLRLLDESRLSRDPVRIACVDEKLTEVNSFTRMIAVRRDYLLEAESRNDRDAVEHERRVIRSLVAQLRRLERQGRACVDRDAARDGTEVEVQLDPDLPREDLAIR